MISKKFSESTDVRSRPLNLLKVCTAFFEQAISEINHLTINLGKKAAVLSPQEIPADVKPPCWNDSIIRLHPYVLQIAYATHGDELRVNSFGLQEPRLRILPRVVAQADVDLK